MSNGKYIIIYLIVGSRKNTLYKMSHYRISLGISFQKRDINVKVDLSNHATKLDLNNSLGTDTSKLALKSNLAKKLK